MPSVWISKDIVTLEWSMWHFTAISSRLIPVNGWVLHIGRPRAPLSAGGTYAAVRLGTGTGGMKAPVPAVKGASLQEASIAVYAVMTWRRMCHCIQRLIIHVRKPVFTCAF